MRYVPFVFCWSGVSHASCTIAMYFWNFEVLKKLNLQFGPVEILRLWDFDICFVKFRNFKTLELQNQETFYVQVRESPAPLNMLTPTPAPFHYFQGSPCQHLMVHTRAHLRF